MVYFKREEKAMKTTMKKISIEGNTSREKQKRNNTFPEYQYVGLILLCQSVNFRVCPVDFLAMSFQNYFDESAVITRNDRIDASGIACKNHQQREGYS